MQVSYHIIIKGKIGAAAKVEEIVSRLAGKWNVVKAETAPTEVKYIITEKTDE